MKRRVLALCAGLLLVGLVPGLTLAVNPPNLDQSNDVGAALTNLGSGTYAQTFTVAKNGMLSGVDLNLQGGSTINVDIKALDGSGDPTGSSLASGSATAGTPSAGAWEHFGLSTPLAVSSGAKLAIVFAAAYFQWAYGSDHGTDAYPGGQSLAFISSSWNPPAGPNDPPDFAFRTYVDTATTALQWDKPQITAGATTQLTLTATMTYANGVEANHYKALVGLLPTWFTPTGLTCSDTASEIIPADCTVANLGNGFGDLIPANATGDVLTFTVTGTADPAASDVGTPGLAGADACVRYPETVNTICGDGTASVSVLAAAATPAPTKAATPPPTSTDPESASDNTGGIIWFLPFALVAFLGGLLVLVDRRRQIS
jgi:hypothetical protein